jgi:hypothetical protein
MNEMQRRQTRGFAEADVFTGWKHVLCYVQRAGVKSGIKRGARRRERREGKALLREEKA